MKSLLSGQPWMFAAASAVMAVAVPMWVLWPRPQRADPPSVAAPYRLDMPAGMAAGPAVMTMPFSAARDPDFRQGGDAAGNAGPQAASTPPRLVGLVGRVRGPGVALIQLADGTTTLVAAGEAAAGFTVEAIGRDSITFSDGGNRQVVRLDYGNRQEGQPAAAAGAIQP